VKRYQGWSDILFLNKKISVYIDILAEMLIGNYFLGRMKKENQFLLWFKKYKLYFNSILSQPNMAHPMKVLIIDDDQDFTGLLSRYLIAKGFENVATNDPIEGLKLIKKEKYDFVLLDIAMPEFSGRDIIHALESKNILKDQKIIIFSAHTFSQQEVNELFEKKGVHSILSKPLKLDAILTAISSWKSLLYFGTKWFEIIFWEGWELKNCKKPRCLD